MHQRILFCLFISIGLTVNAQTAINLRGTVSNQAGKPITNAIVTLAKQGLKDTTGSDGAYSITGPIVAVLPLLIPQKESIFLDKGVLVFSIPNPSIAKVEIFDVKGNLLKKESVRNIPAGFYRYTIAENSGTAKLLVIKASSGQHEATFRYLPLHNGNYSVNRSDGSRSSFGENKLTLLAAVNDTLKTAAANYKTQVTVVTSYDQQVNITLDTAGGTVSEGCGKTPPASGQAATIDVDGTKREYILTLPENYNSSNPYILIFVPHPMGGTMQQTVSGGYLGLKSVSNNKAIFVAPNGIDNGFANTNGRDVKFFKAMLDLFNSTLCIDQKRIFSTGFSYGGMMSFAVGCAMWDKFRAIAPCSGAFYSGCDKSKQGPIAVWQAHGTSDNVVPLKDGITARDYFLERNGCGKETKPVNPSPCVAYQGCKDGYPYIYCEFSGGHAPQNWQAAAIWAFFSQF